MAFDHQVHCLKDLHQLIHDHVGESGVRVCIGGYLAQMCDATAMENLLAEKENEGWVVDIGALELFVCADRAVSKAHGLLDYILNITKPAAAQAVSSIATAASDKPSAEKSVRLTTCINSPDYGTAAFAKRVADSLFRRAAASPDCLPDANSNERLRLTTRPARSAGHQRNVNSPDRLLDGYCCPGRSLSAEHRGGTNFRVRSLSAGRRSDVNSLDRDADSRGRSLSAGRRSDVNSLDRDADSRGRSLSPARRRDDNRCRPRSASCRRRHRDERPAGRFVTPEVAERVSDAGSVMREVPVQKIRALGERMHKLGLRLIREKEPVTNLRADIQKLNKDIVKCWTGTVSANELLLP